MNTTDAMVQVRITADGTCFIDDEFFAPPPGASLNEAVLSHLQLEAAAAEAPVRAAIHDEQANYTMAIQVNTDGTSQPLRHDPAVLPPTPVDTSAANQPSDEPPTDDRPYELLPEPYRARLATICVTARQDRFGEAAADADQLISELTAQYGPTHLYTLAAGSVRGDIAWLIHEDRYALQIWTFIAKAWHKLLGPAHKTTVHAVGNAIGCWRRLPPPDALNEGDQVTALLQEVPIPHAASTLRAVRQRLWRLAATS